MKCLLLLIGLLLSTETLVAQLSQIERFYPFSLPNITNPANTGFFLNESSVPFFRIQSNNQVEYHNTWNDFDTKLNLDYRRAVFKEDFLGFGFDYQLRKSFMKPSYENTYKIRASYQKHFGRRVKDVLSLGINVGVQDVNLSTHRVWYYQQEQGVSWMHPSDRDLYQVGLTHKMRFLLDDSSNNLHTSKWEHWAGLQGHGEWQLSRQVRLNFLVNYQYQFFGWNRFSKHLLGGTIATAYGFGRRRQHELILGLGAKWMGWDVNHEIPLTYNFFAGYEYNKFRMMAHFSFRYNANHSTMNRAQTSYQFGLSLAYHIFRIRRLGGVPIWI